MRKLELQVSELLAAAQQERKAPAKLDAGPVDTVFKVGELLQTKELLDAVDICKLWQRWEGTGCLSQCLVHARAPAEDAVQPDGERGPAQALPRAGRRPSGSGPGVGPGALAGGRAP
jgi:hypothetical protein